MGSNKDDKNETCDILDLMETFGKYQIIQYVFICLPLIFVSMTSVNFIFAVGDIDHRCRIDKCDDRNSTAQFPSWWPDANIDRCSKPVLRTGEEVCTNNSFSGELATCDNWIYENNNTVVAELNLACQPWKTNFVGTIHYMGLVVSLVVSGFMCDKFGRKPTLIFCVVGGSIGIIKTFATSYYMYIAIEFLESSIIGGTYAAASVLLMESVGKKFRVFSCTLYAFTTQFGECLIVCIAKFVPYWKTFIRIINGPFIFFIFIIFFINESTRWYLVSGKVENSKKNMKKIADYNKIHINNEELTNIEESKLKEKFDIKNNEVKESLMSALKSKEMMKRLLVACLGRFTTNFVYFGILVHSVWLPGDKYLNYFLSALFSMPGQLLSLYLMNKVGRKSPLQVGYLLCGALSITCGIVPERYLWVKLTFFVIAKVMISACFTGAIAYSMELFPTSVRGTLVGLASIAAHIGCILAALIPLLNTLSKVVPFSLFGFFSIVSGISLWITPETKNLPLFDTIEQVEEHAKDKVKTNNIAVISLETITSKL